MQLLLERFAHGRTSTLGRLSVNGVHRCFTLEDEHREQKVAGETRVPDGTYRITLRTEGGFHARYAKRFGRLHKGMLWLREVPGFEYILIHVGNSHEDTAGCILVGRSPAVDAEGEFSVVRSKAAYVALYSEVADALLRKETVTITITSVAA